MREITQSLQEALESKVVMEQALRQQQEAMEKQLETARSDQQRSKETMQSLRQELGQLREEYEKGEAHSVTLHSESFLHFKDFAPIWQELFAIHSRLHTKQKSLVLP